jgi:hypothetical protein
MSRGDENNKKTLADLFSKWAVKKGLFYSRAEIELMAVNFAVSLVLGKPQLAIPATLFTRACHWLFLGDYKKRVPAIVRARHSLVDFFTKRPKPELGAIQPDSALGIV